MIGEGAFGKVYQGFDEEQGRLIAIKELDLAKVNKKNIIDMSELELEINILSKLYHKNIVKYYGVVRSQESINIILEYCIGGSVAKILETYKNLPESIIRKYTQQILEGLEYLHSHNIIHRDIKGANILVDRDGVCKLSDFGGAKIMEDEIDLKKQSFRGTPNWMAPETVKKLEYTRFSDIWSIGCTVIEMAIGKYFLILGEPPWANQKSPMAVLTQLYNTKEPPKVPENLSPDLRDFIRCCLRIEPRDRLNVFQLLRHPFITGDIFTFHNTAAIFEKNIEVENKFVTEDKPSRYSLHLL
jgi:serine/threonine protein kinase